jgi:hypothetical protein
MLSWNADQWTSPNFVNKSGDIVKKRAQHLPSLAKLLIADDYALIRVLQPIRLILAEDQALVRAALRSLLQRFFADS